MILQDFSFHLPKRTGHFPDKTPLALHIGFQIFRALPICLPDCFPLLRQKAAPSKVKTLSELYHKNFLFFTRWHETTIFREWKAKKSHQPALVLPLIFFNFTVYYHAKLHIITETPYKHENSEQFPCLYYFPRISTAFSIKLIYLSAKNNNILLLFTFPLYTITETPDFCVKVYFCLIVRFFPQSPSYQRHPKTKKLGPTTHRDEPHQALKPLILSHSSILSPASTKNPMALFLNSRLCRC